MFKNILVPVEPSHVERHREALETAQALADDGAKITAVTVIEPMPGYFTVVENLPDLQMQASQKTLQDLKALAANGGIETRVLHGQPATEINTYAEKEDADCIVIASHQPGFADYFLGSTAARVVRHAPCSVLVLR